MSRLCLLAAAAALLAGCNAGTSTAPPTAAGGQARKLVVKALYEHKVHRDGTDELTVSVDRDNFAGPVAVALRDLPAGVSVVTQDLSIPAGKDSVKVTVRAAPDAPLVDDHAVTVAATAEGLPEAATTFKLDVLAKQ